MNQILSFDKSFGAIRVQPGVSIAQINNFLLDDGAEWVIPPGGMTPEASLIGNTMERGLSGGKTGERVEKCLQF